VPGAPGRGGKVTTTFRSAAVRARVYVASARSDESGQAVVEYALILFLVALVSIAILAAVGSTVSGMFSDVVTDF